MLWRRVRSSSCSWPRSQASRVGSRRAGRLGHGVGDEERLRDGNRQEGDGRADQARWHDMLIPGVDFTTIGKVADAYFQCVNDNGGINGRPIQYIAVQRAAQSRRTGGARPEADRERQGRRHRRQHELQRVRDQLEVLQVQGLHRDRRRRPGRVLRHAVLSSSRTWARATATWTQRSALVRAARSRS